MDKMTKKIIGVFSAIIVLAAIIIGVYFAMGKQAQKEARESVLPSSEIGKLLAKDLDTKYPETPTEVVKLYWRLNCCMYNKSKGMTDEYFEKLLKQQRKLYDEDFLASSANSYDKMLKKFKNDRAKRLDAGQNMSQYNVQKNDTVEVKKIDGKENATVATSVLIKAKGETTKVYENFMCRKAEDGKWKILGWQQINQATALEAGVE